MLKALIVDDDKNVLNGLKMLIPWQKLGYELVGVASNGQAGFEMAMKYNPDVIISDVVMPTMDGTELLQKVMPRLSNVSFIFLSAYESFPAAQLALQYHVQAYILKPIDREKLNMIGTELEKIAERNMRVGYFHDLIDDRTGEIRRALETGDRPYFEHLFSGLMNDALRFVDDSGMIRRVCGQLLGLMKDVDGSVGDSATGLALKSIKDKMDMIALTANECYAFIDRKHNSQNPENPPIISAVCELIHQNIAQEELGLALIASKMNYSPSYLSRIFTKYVGISLMDYIAMKRMEVATALLRNSQMNITEIAGCIGYRNANYFSRVFKNSFGCLPTEYRQACREGRRV